MIFKARLQFDLKEWLEESAPDLIHCIPDLSEADLYLSHYDDTENIAQNYSIVLNSTLTLYEQSMSYEDDMKDYFIESERPTSRSDHRDEDDYGTELGGKWDVIGFVIRSGIVFTLAVLEEFERGLLRILVLHGHHSAEKNKQNKKLFIPRLKDYLKESSEWRKIRKRAYTVFGRQKLLKSYAINPCPKVDWVDRINGIRSKRNEIAHGFNAPHLKFIDFLNLHYDVYRAMNYYSQEALNAQNIKL